MPIWRKVIPAFSSGILGAHSTRKHCVMPQSDTATTDTQPKEATEREVLAVMRQVLASIIKDTTPAHREMRHPLSPGTIEDVRQCFALIAARERELAAAAGAVMEKPYFSDDIQAVKTVSLSQLKASLKN